MVNSKASTYVYNILSFLAMYVLYVLQNVFTILTIYYLKTQVLITFHKFLFSSKLFFKVKTKHIIKNILKESNK